MRGIVRKARVGVVWKLTKQIKLLKNRKYGDDEFLRKCKKKSEKFIREIKTIKKLKDDDITKFAILNTRHLQEVLADAKTDRKTRVMSKLAFHKSLKNAIDEFRRKFPHYQLGKRQLIKSKLNKSSGMNSSHKFEKTSSEDENGRIKPQNEKDNYHENEASDGEKYSKNEKSENEISGDSDKELQLQGRNLELEKMSGDETAYIEKNEIKLSKSPDSTDTELLKPQPTIHKNSREKSSPLPASNSVKEDNKSESKRWRNSRSSPDHISCLLNKNLVDQNMEQGSSKLTVMARILQSQKLCKKSEEFNFETPEIGSNLVPVSKPKNSPPTSGKIKVVSNLASVKRLKIGESLEETDEVSENLNFSPQEREKELDTVEDSFFMSTTPGGVYKSIIIRRSNLETRADENADGLLKKSSANIRRASFNSSNHREDTSGYIKNRRVQQSDFTKNRRVYSERVEFSRNRRGTGFREDNELENNRGRDMIETKKDYEENLHPSWVARKKQQEVLKQGFQGKKIVFRDD